MQLYKSFVEVFQAQYAMYLMPRKSSRQGDSCNPAIYAKHVFFLI